MSSDTGVRMMSPVNSHAVFLASIPEVPSNTWWTQNGNIFQLWPDLNLRYSRCWCPANIYRENICRCFYMVGSSTASLHKTTISSHMLAHACAATSVWPLLRPVCPLALLWEADVLTLYHQPMIWRKYRESSRLSLEQSQNKTHLQTNINQTVKNKTKSNKKKIKNYMDPIF